LSEDFGAAALGRSGTRSTDSFSVPLFLSLTSLLSSQESRHNVWALSSEHGSALR
jgi:hypothetical protein